MLKVAKAAPVKLQTFITMFVGISNKLLIKNYIYMRKHFLFCFQVQLLQQKSHNLSGKESQESMIWKKRCSIDGCMVIFNLLQATRTFDEMKTIVLFCWRMLLTDVIYPAKKPTPQFVSIRLRSKYQTTYHYMIIIKCHLETTYNNSAVEAEVDGEKLHPKMCHLKCSNIKFKFLSFYTCTYGFFQFIFVSWSCPVKI